MREPTKPELAAAKRAAAKTAKAIREKSGNPTVRGTLIQAFYDDGTADLLLTSRYGIDEVHKAARDLGHKAHLNPSLTVSLSVPVTYPKDEEN